MTTPAPIQAKPLRHPGRWVLAAIVLGLSAWFVIGALTNEPTAGTPTAPTSSTPGSPPPPCTPWR